MNHRPPPLPEVEEAFASGSIFEDPHGVYRTLRTHAPIYWCEHLGQWLVTSFELVEHVLRQPRLFSNFGFDSAYISRLGAEDRTSLSVLIHHFEQRGLIQADPPDHTRLRRGLGPRFAASVVEQLRPAIETAVGELLAEAPPGFDAMRDLAGPLPVRVISDLLGVNADDRDGFPIWSQAAVSFFGTPQPDPVKARNLENALVEWRALIVRLLDERMREPRVDLLSTLAALVTTEEISKEEALFTSVHLLIAGHETTTNLIGNALYHLLRNPRSAELVRTEPTLLPNAIEEVLRFEPPIQRIRRMAACDTELAGMKIRVGDPVIPILAAANRDPSRFANPDTLDIRRPFVGTTARPASFGHGVHFCLGAPLARLEAVSAVSAVLNRPVGARLTSDYTPVWRQTINMRGLERLPIKPELIPVD